MAVYTLQAPDGNTYDIEAADNATHNQLFGILNNHLAGEAAAQKAHEKKTGFISAAKAGFHEALGAGEQALGEVSGSKKLQDWAKENALKAQTEHEATTEADVENAKGMMGTAGKWMSKNVTEPLGGILGSYGVPIAAGIAGAALAPEALIGAGAAAGAEALTGEAAVLAAQALAKREAMKRLVGAGVTTAAAQPAEMGRNLQAQEEAHPGVAHDLTTAALASIPEAALVGFGFPGTKYINKLVPELMPAAQTLVPKVLSGEMTAEAAQAALASKTMQYLKAMAANTAAGTGMMVGTEDIRRAQAGQDLMSGSEMLETAKTAAILSPLFAAFHPSDRAAAHAALTEAEATRGRTNEQNQLGTHGGTEAEVASADAARAIDLEGLQKVNDFYNPIRNAANQAKEHLETVIYPQLREELNIRREKAFEAVPVADLNTQEGIKKVIASLKENTDISDVDRKEQQSLLNKQLKLLKQKANAYKELSPKEQMMATVFDAHQSLRESGIDPSVKLYDQPLETLHALKEGIDERVDDPNLSKQEQHTVGYMSRWINKAIADHPETMHAEKQDTRTAQEAEFQKTLEDKRAAETELTQQRDTAEQQRLAAEHTQRLATLDIAHKQDVMNAFQQGPESWRAFQEKQAAIRGEKPEQIKLADMPDEYFNRNPEITPPEAYAQIIRSTAKGRTADRAEADRFAEGQKALEAQYKQEHQAAQVEDFGLKKQKPSDIAEPKAEEAYIPTKLSAEGPEQGVSNQVKGQGELFTPKTGEPTKAAANKGPVVEPVVAAETALKEFNKRNTKKQTPATKTAEPEPTEAQPSLRESITTQQSKIKAVEDRAKAFEIDLDKSRPDLVDDLINLKSQVVEAADYNQWAKEVDAVTKEAQAHLSEVKQTQGKIGSKSTVPLPVGSKLSEKGQRAQAKTDRVLLSRTSEESTTPTRNVKSSELFGANGEESKKSPKEPKTVSTEPTTTEKLHDTVKDWFSPVWLIRALKNGWLHIEDSIHDTDLPQEVKDKYSESKGVYFGKDGAIYLFAKNITEGHELGVILHEIGEHKGLDNMIGKDRVTQLANRVRAMAEGKKGTLDQKIATKALARIEGMDGVKADKELIAYFTEIAVNEHDMKPNGKANLESKGTLDWLKTLWTSISSALEKLHFKPESFNAQDLVNVVHGAARLEMGREGRVAGEEHIMESKKPQLTTAEIAARKAQGLTVFAPDPKQNAIQSVKTMYKTVGMMRDKLDNFGVSMVGPLYSAHRKATEYYGPDGFYTKATNKIRGTLLMQHTLNAMNFIIPSMRNGSLTIDAKGYFHQVIDKTNNIPELAKKYDAIQKAMKSNGVSDAVIDQDIKTMLFADRYKSLKDKGIKNLGEFSDESYKLGKELQAKYAKEYKEWRDMYNNIRNNKRELLIKSGLMTAKKVDEFLDRLEYLPLYRMSENEAMDAVFMSSLTAATREQKLKYNTEAFAVGDPMDNIMKNEMWLYQRAMRNHTANRMADEFSEMGLGRFVKNRQANDKNVITILKDGELAHFQVDNPNDAAVFQAAPTAHGMAVGAMRVAASFVRRGVTITPSFAYRQMWDDVERTWMQSGGERSFLGTLAKSASGQGKNLFKDTAETKALEAHGVVGQVDIQDGFNRMMQHMMGTHNDTWLGKAESMLEGAERVARNSDMAARLSVYDSVIAQAKKAGRTDMDVVQKEAALRAQMMINFNHKGTSGVVRTLTAMVPFINARIQSDWRLMDAVKGNIPGVSKEQAHKMLMFKVAKFATFTALYSMARSGDADYEDASEEARNRNFLFDIGGVPLKVPVAPEYALLKGAAEHSYRMLTDQEFENSTKMRHAISTGIGNLLVTPTDVMPSMIRPFLENITNHSFFNDRTLVSPTLSGLDKNKQYVEGQTSELAIYLSDVGQSMFGNEFNSSPIKIDNVLRGMFGTLGTDIAYTSNLISNWVGDSERPASKLNQIPEIGALFYDPNGSQRKNDFYTLREKVAAAHNTLLSLKGKPEEAAKYREENAALLRLNGQVNAITNQFEQIRKQKKTILESPLSRMDGDQKREALDALAEREKKLLGTRVQEMNRQLEESQD